MLKAFIDVALNPHILIKNLDSDNIRLRRKSVKAIAYFGKDIVSNINFYSRLIRSKVSNIFSDRPSIGKTSISIKRTLSYSSKESSTKGFAGS